MPFFSGSDPDFFESPSPFPFCPKELSGRLSKAGLSKPVLVLISGEDFVRGMSSIGAMCRGDGVGAAIVELSSPIDNDTSFLYGYVAVSAEDSDPCLELSMIKSVSRDVKRIITELQAFIQLVGGGCSKITVNYSFVTLLKILHNRITPFKYNDCRLKCSLC